MMKDIIENYLLTGNEKDFDRILDWIQEGGRSDERLNNVDDETVSTLVARSSSPYAPYLLHMMLEYNSVYPTFVTLFNGYTLAHLAKTCDMAMCLYYHGVPVDELDDNQMTAFAKAARDFIFGKSSEDEKKIDEIQDLLSVMKSVGSYVDCDTHDDKKQKITPLQLARRMRHQNLELHLKELGASDEKQKTTKQEE